jgi:hypothetical protein
MNATAWAGSEYTYRMSQDRRGGSERLVRILRPLQKESQLLLRQHFRISGYSDLPQQA